ncbi:TPA: N-acetylglucosamine-6-phosphate deacetylase [Streptococcus equi subsp. zooepidemicus]|uniref:N-acetylglucosamine-6-phosphate deacetylase n=1 Tax=Streptococcus equi TaxID=1336 RepID=UPI0024A90E07|nr:N-acetylglucosamine-6-phosphate deacetylase [Streptococcus equi]MDI6043142.1 N-acetylglucosamine-6-phosphate deacetylase [Streptococcus equi subsp. zooepidemicus]HEL0023967.1 N-acetylglucosamine-6-phosphate deacetylase [Streptococcus equi subsp. zooepidemicus]HEL0562286.1 N-acetylglucosamine-6-phosphate deacetylase [Streptococcus equi subsp. zooepidemicus]HEL0626875.1 N-acetylglucosamine-6-phosphate deacetylase [Streptococcus equi subsp. zooepidemicus]HEL0723677.1 N-acetylglucosamine-6-phos
MTSYIKADCFYYPNEVKPAGYLELNNGTFGHWTATVDDQADVIDYTGYQIAPGLVDTHIHGYAGADVMDNSAEGLHAISEGLLSTGVTSFLPTTLTSTFEHLEQVSATVASVADQVKGAKIQGIYFEGPYFTEEYKGAQNPMYMKNPRLDEFAAWQKAAKGLIKKIALAPERDGVEAFVSEVTKQGVTVALGHSNGTYAEAKKAVAAGASVWVHAYNGMRGLTHREPGMVGAVYNIPGTVAELICDGHHVSPVACDILMQQKGHEHVALITDCMRAGGSPDGDYMLGEFPVIVENGTARLKDSGNLAGSILKLKDGIKNVVAWGIASPAEAIHMSSYVPAASVGIEDVCGQIKAGHAADFIVLDKDLELVATYLNGQKAFEA